VNPSDADPAGTEGSPGSRGSPVGRVRVGRFILEIGTPAGTAILEADGREPEDVQALQGALKEDKGVAPEPRDAALADAATALVDEASDATSKAERATRLFTELAEGRIDAQSLSGEIPALLDLLERLDREGRWSEALRLARALSGLLGLMMRWVELVRSLRIALRAAEKLGDLRAIGWAMHELGTLHLGAEKAPAAERRLGQAHEIRRRAGDREGLAVTEHNLQALCRLMRNFLRERRLVERNTLLQRLRYSPALIAAVAVALLAGGGIAGAMVGGSGGGSDANGGGGPAGEQRGGGPGDRGSNRGGPLADDGQADSDVPSDGVDGDGDSVSPPDPPVDGEDPPVDGEDPPVQEDPPVDGEDPPVDGEDPPVDGEDPPVDVAGGGASPPID
jgi:hypothetical protein